MSNQMSRPVIFYSPHADDETLNMGITIAEHVAAGRDTHVVLMTHGRVTGALDAINGVTLSGYWKAMHNPSFEGYSPLTKADLEQARIREFHHACAQLGVPPSNRHIEYLDDPTTGETVTKAEAKAVIQNYVNAYPISTTTTQRLVKHCWNFTTMARLIIMSASSYRWPHETTMKTTDRRRQDGKIHRQTQLSQTSL